MTPVLVLDVGYQPINVCTVKRAIILLIKEKAEAVETDEAELHSEKVSFSRPAVIRLVTYVRIPYDGKRRITRRAVLARDNWSCQYCGRTSGSLTVDHVVARSKGGKTEWTNIVTACVPCNSKKGDRSPRDAGLRLLQEPTVPKRQTFVMITTRTPPLLWQQWID